jgi:hypothetical protein
MSCECYKIGGRFIAEDPECPAHGAAAQAEQAKIDLVLDEVRAWRERFPSYVYRPQDDTISLKLGV